MQTHQRFRSGRGISQPPQRLPPERKADGIGVTHTRAAPEPTGLQQRRVSMGRSLLAILIWALIPPATWLSEWIGRRRHCRP